MGLVQMGLVQMWLVQMGVVQMGVVQMGVVQMQWDRYRILHSGPLGPGCCNGENPDF